MLARPKLSWKHADEDESLFSALPTTGFASTILAQETARQRASGLTLCIIVPSRLAHASKWNLRDAAAHVWPFICRFRNEDSSSHKRKTKIRVIENQTHRHSRRPSFVPEGT